MTVQLRCSLVSDGGRHLFDRNCSTGVGDGSYEDFLQTDAPIHHGNSGGALVNTQGEFVGINSQIVSFNGQPVRDYNTLRNRVAEAQPGSNASVGFALAETEP